MNIINKKNILFFSLTTLMINGCVAKNGLEVKSPELKTVETKRVLTKKVLPKPSWGKVASVKAKKDDCVDCYAVPMDYSKPPLASNNTLNKAKKAKNVGKFGKYAYTKKVSDTTVKTAMTRNVIKPKIVNNKVTSALLSTNSAYGTLSSATMGSMAIQVGAFRKYKGAKIYANKYRALSDRYKVAIKKGTKNNKTIYRVRIEGFNTKSEAKNFMYSYGISDGFLVRK
ncbi:MAG: Unknown protein [uncultured Sulfurovum sp.]|uniref:SPOR domain-containing protein n=1 Tax=uncultured Sulfurovum sp. TaxID=269237 RepID=A0A6S6SGM2_9BACT|nr:MAG: Unknown protein [uncultured Sulfurovum sp.]